MGRTIFTKRGYNLYEVTSAMQKAIRRNDVKIAGYFGLELFHSGYQNYLWKRLLTISAEDCAGVITKEIQALMKSWDLINAGIKNTSEKNKGRIFVSKAIIILCTAMKSRDADHLQLLIYDKKFDMTDQEIDSYLEQTRDKTQTVPGYTHDCHTREGKNLGKTKENFIREELDALNPYQGGLFDNIVQDKNRPKL